MGKTRQNKIKYSVQLAFCRQYTESSQKKNTLPPTYKKVPPEACLLEGEISPKLILTPEGVPPYLQTECF